MLSEFGDIIYCDNPSVIKLKIKEKYGSGYITFYEIFSNIYLIYNDYHSFNNFYDEDGVLYNFPVINIQYYLKGELKLKLKNKAASFIREGENLFYSGIGSMVEASSSTNSLVAFTLFCYNDDVSFLSNEFNIERERIEYFFNSLVNRDDFFIFKSDNKTNLILKELVNYVDDNNLTMIKLRGIELFVNAIN